MRRLPGFMHIPFWFYRLRRSLYLSPEQLRDLQRRRLTAIIRHAYEYVPYYRQLFDRAGVNPRDIRSVEDLQSLPVTTKADLREYPRQALITPYADGRNSIPMMTSGSTGMPFQILLSRQESWLRYLNFLRALMETGYRLTDRLVMVDRGHDKEKHRWWLQGLGVLQEYHVCVFDDLDVQLAKLRQIRPQYICGYPSALKRLAQALIEQEIADIKPRAVGAFAEALSEGARDIIRQGFDAPVFDFYGAIEFGNIAWECPAGTGYHINSDLVLVEFLVDGRPAQPGERAELVCTSLYRYTMPFIRYNLGDVGVRFAETCSCGRGLPLMGPVEGRIFDLIKLPSGRNIPSIVTLTIGEIPGIKQYQVVQETLTSIVVWIVPGTEFSHTTLMEVEACCKRLFAQEVQVTVEVVDSLPLEPSGKFRVVKSKVQQDT